MSPLISIVSHLNTYKNNKIDLTFWFINVKLIRPIAACEGYFVCVDFKRKVACCLSERSTPQVINSHKLVYLN